MKQIDLYADGVIAVRLEAWPSGQALSTYVAVKYLAPRSGRKDGIEIPTTNIMGGETEWFILPYTFGEVVGKKLFEQFHAGLGGFQMEGVQALKSWLLDMEVITDAMCY